MQVASLKDTIAKKDEEIERLQLLKDLKNACQGVNGEKRGTTSIKYESFSSNSALFKVIPFFGKFSSLTNFFRHLIKKKSTFWVPLY